MADERKPHPKAQGPVGQPLRVRQLATKPPKPARPAEPPKPPHKPRARSSFPGWIVSGRFGRVEDRHEPTVAPGRAVKPPLAPAKVDAFEWAPKGAPAEPRPVGEPLESSEASGGGLSMRVLVIGAALVLAVALIVRALK